MTAPQPTPSRYTPQQKMMLIIASFGALGILLWTCAGLTQTGMQMNRATATARAATSQAAVVIPATAQATIAIRPTRQPTLPVVATISGRTQTPFVTSTSVFVESSATPAPASASDRYVTLAKAGIKLPSTRGSFGYGVGEWSAFVNQPGDIMLTMPLEPGLSNEQTVRLGKLKMAQAIKALFDGDTALTRIAALGTLPDGTGAEGQAISIVITRDVFSLWDGLADNLGEWRVTQRLR